MTLSGIALDMQPKLSILHHIEWRILDSTDCAMRNLVTWKLLFMTLAAQFTYKHNKSIFMLGDGLISSEIEPSGNFIMPGSGKLSHPRSRHGYFVGLEQKLNVLGKDLAFVWSARRDLALRFATELLEIYEDDSYQFDMLKSFLDRWTATLPPKDRDEIKLIVVAWVDGTYMTWRYGLKEIKGYKHFDSLLIAGTGTLNFLDTIGQESGNIETDDQAIGQAMNVLNKFYHDDLFIKSNYSDAFGGFYELAECSQSGIEKLSDVFITTLHIDAKQLDRGFAVPLKFLKYDTLDGLSVLREVRATGDENAPDLKNFGHACLPIIPKYREKAMKVFERLQTEGNCFESKIIGDMKAKYTLIMLELVDGESVRKIPLYYRRPNRNSPLSLSLEDGQAALFFATELIEEINSVIEKYIDKDDSRLKEDEEL